MSSIFITIPSYAEPDLPRTIDSAIRASSGLHEIRISVVEQMTRYAETYALARVFDQHVILDVQSCDRLLGASGARHWAETRYSGEDLQVGIDAHARFETDWDVAIVSLCDRVGEAIVSGLTWSDPWRDGDRVPVTELNRFENGVPFGCVQLVKPESGSISETYPARTVLAGSMVGRAWCTDVPADPHILFGGEEPVLAARLWSSGRRLLHGRLPWYQATPSEARSGERPWNHPEWAERDKMTGERVDAIMAGYPLSEDHPAGAEMNTYGLSPAALSEWVAYSGIDYKTGTVRTPWP